jgi:protein ImuA
MGWSGAGASEGLQPGLPGPEQLHPALWRAHQVGQQRGVVVPSGFAALDAELPGGGWPARALTELLLPHLGIGEVRLLAPALAAVQRDGRNVMLFDPPAALCGWTLAALGLDLRHLVVVQARQPLQGDRCQGKEGPALARPVLPASDVLWALEQALKSGHVGAVLAWLPARARPEAVRRLQLAAQAHDGPAFLLRDLQALARPSAAPLRLSLAPTGPDALALRIVKRRGPPLAQPLWLALTPALSAPARARALREAPQPVVGPQALPPVPVDRVDAADAAAHD